jgi:hypothetical protein
MVFAHILEKLGFDKGGDEKKIAHKTQIIELPEDTSSQQRLIELLQQNSIDQFILPPGYSYVIVGTDDVNKIKGCCMSCGAPTTLAMTQCGYCGIGRSHIKLKKDREKVEEAMPLKLTPGKTLVNSKEVKATIYTRESDIGDNASVGVVYGDDITLGKHASAMAIHGVDVKMYDRSRSGDVIAMGLDAGQITAARVTIVKEGSISLGKGSSIGTLCLDRTVPTPDLKGISVNTIIRGDFNLPKLITRQPVLK